MLKTLLKEDNIKYFRLIPVIGTLTVLAPMYNQNLE